MPLALVLVGVLVAVVVMAVGGPGTAGGPQGQVGTAANLEAVLTQAKSLLQNAKPKAAERLLRDAAERWPNDQSLHLTWAEALLGCERYADAYEQYDRAISIGPDRAEYRFAATMAAFKAGLPDRAVDQCEIARSLDRSNPQYPLYLAQIQRKLGHTEEARANLVIAAKLDPSIAITWGTLAAIALDQNNPGMGLDYIAKARKLEPESNVWRVLHAKLLRRDGRPREGADLLLAMAEFERSNDLTVVEELANCLGMLQKPGDAAEVYIKALAAAPDNAALAYQAAVWLDRSEQRSSAMEYARRAAMGGCEPAKALLEKLERPAEKSTATASPDQPPTP